MDINKPMPLVLIEEDIDECLSYKTAEKRFPDVQFVGMTDSGLENWSNSTRVCHLILK